MDKKVGRETEVSRPPGRRTKERQPLLPATDRMTEALLAFRQNGSRNDLRPVRLMNEAGVKRFPGMSSGENL